MAEKPTSTSTAKQTTPKRDGHTASINIQDVQAEFDLLKKHCEDQTPWMKPKNSDIVRFAFIMAAKTLGAKHG